MKNRVEINVGDEIIVNGYIFVLTEMTIYKDKPAVVKFMTPGELIVQTEIQIDPPDEVSTKSLLVTMVNNYNSVRKND